ncbi:hypothetical protein D5F01_LYC03740 [Larimichthys crocea]|uniref:Uncharacterized protein n=1 Tax=Larimichthys crocea TaxID=215358 RepID=A0A6G0J027_LARCR|nr:hypothetical protein D5F01_LYC03740 [Larimichthys crocea]
MATLKKEEHTAVNGSDRESSTQEDTAGEQRDRTADRRHVEALLDISEEDFLKELEPYEDHCYSGWDEAVQGWARVAPLSCILLTQKTETYKKPKNKEFEKQTLLSVDPTIPNADISTNNAENRCESRMGVSRNNVKKSMAFNQHLGSWNNTAVAALQRDVLDALQKTSSALLEERIEEEVTLRVTPLQNRPTKLQKHSHRPSNSVVPIKNFTFLPPIKSPHLSPQRVSGKKVPEGETIEEQCFMFDKMSSTRGKKVDTVANSELPTSSAGLTSKLTCQHNPHLFSSVSVSIPKKYQVPLSSKRDTALNTNFPMGKNITQDLYSSPAAGAQARLRPSKTVWCQAV